MKKRFIYTYGIYNEPFIDYFDDFDKLELKILEHLKQGEILPVEITDSKKHISCRGLKAIKALIGIEEIEE